MFKVLLVDDEPLIREGLKKLILWEEHGLEIAGETSFGEEALEMLQRTGAHILVTDIRMPGMDGLELIRAVREREWDTKCIILSGYDDFEYVKQSLQLGIENYLLKPVSRDELSLTLLNTVQKIEAALYKNISEREGINTLKQIVLCRWLTDNISQDELESKAPMLDLDMGAGRYTVGIIRPVWDREREAAMSGRDKNLLNFAADNICTEILAQRRSGFSFCDLNGDVVLIFPGNEDADGEADADGDAGEAEAVRECMEAIRRYLKLEGFAALGPTVRNSRNACDSYREARNLLQYGLFLSSGQVIRFEQMKEKSRALLQAVDLDFSRIDKAVATKDSAALQAFFDDVYDQLQAAEGIAPDSVQNVTVELLIRLVQSVQNSRPAKDLTVRNYRELLSDLFDQKDVGRLKEWLRGKIAEMLAHLTEAEERSNPLVKDVLAHIHAHYEESLSLKTLSDQFNINTAYLGQLFKRETGEMFSNYLNRIRVDKAKKLLAGTPMKLQEVSEKVGYVNAIYFSRIFRKIAGVSPQEYKLSHK